MLDPMPGRGETYNVPPSPPGIIVALPPIHRHNDIQ